MRENRTVNRGMRRDVKEEREEKDGRTARSRKRVGKEKTLSQHGKLTTFIDDSFIVVEKASQFYNTV